MYNAMEKRKEKKKILEMVGEDRTRDLRIMNRRSNDYTNVLLHSRGMQKSVLTFDM